MEWARPQWWSSEGALRQDRHIFALGELRVLTRDGANAAMPAANAAASSGLSVVLTGPVPAPVLAAQLRRGREVVGEVEDEGWDPRHVYGQFLAFCRDALHLGMGGDPDFLRTRLSAKAPATVYSKIHGFNNARFEELAGKQTATLNEADRKPLVQEMQRIVAEELPLLSLYVPSRILLSAPDTFDAWYFTPGGLFGLHPGPLNKQAFVTGKKTGV